jgi:hypothetical protein
MDSRRRPDGREVAQHAKGGKGRRPKRWYRGPSESRRWMDAARLLELGTERLVADVLVPVAGEGHDRRAQRVEGGR